MVAQAGGGKRGYTEILFVGMGDVAQGVLTCVLLNGSEWLRSEWGESVGVSCIDVVPLKTDEGETM